ncbi:hypothetical protein Tco_0622923 [Tanacetum coccineum]
MKCWKGVLEATAKKEKGGDQGACKLLGCLLGDVIEVLGCLLEVLGELSELFLVGWTMAGAKRHLGSRCSRQVNKEDQTKDNHVDQVL